MALFLSTYLNKLDKKGRISVPSQYRAALSKEKFSGIVTYPSFVNPCIEACGMERMERLSESIDGLDPYSETRDAFATAILGGSVQLSFDGEGRVMLPEELLKIANIKDSAVFVGKGQTFEIWQPESFESYSEKARIIAKQERAALQLKQSNREGK